MNKFQTAPLHACSAFVGSLLVSPSKQCVQVFLTCLKRGELPLFDPCCWISIRIKREVRATWILCQSNPPFPPAPLRNLIRRLRAESCSQRKLVTSTLKAYIPKPKHMPKYTRVKVPLPKINTHSWAALPGSAADTTSQSLLTHTLTTNWLPAPLRTRHLWLCWLGGFSLRLLISNILKWRTTPVRTVLLTVRYFLVFFHYETWQDS